MMQIAMNAGKGSQDWDYSLSRSTWLAGFVDGIQRHPSRLALSNSQNRRFKSELEWPILVISVEEAVSCEK